MTGRMAGENTWSQSLVRQGKAGRPTWLSRLAWVKLVARDYLDVNSKFCWLLPLVISH